MTYKRVACKNCGRWFKANMDGSVRRHWCQKETGDSKAITLKTGGSLTIRLTANWMLFQDSERDLLAAIVSALDEYERSSAVDGGSLASSEAPQGDLS